MGEDEKDVHARILKYIGEALRGDMTGLTDAPPPGPILLQVLHLIRREQERRGPDAAPVSWEELPEDLKRLLEQFRQHPGRSDV
jgi:hypothetical protein